MHRLGVRSWSLRPQSPRDLAPKLQATGLRAVQLALEPIRTAKWDEQETVRTLREAGITLLWGMMESAGEDYSTRDSIRATGGVRPSATWEQNRRATRRYAPLAHRNDTQRFARFRSGVPMVSG